MTFATGAEGRDGLASHQFEANRYEDPAVGESGRHPSAAAGDEALQTIRQIPWIRLPASSYGIRTLLFAATQLDVKVSSGASINNNTAYWE